MSTRLPVGDHAEERLRSAPDQVLQRQGEREGLAAPAVVEGHRLQEQAEPLPRAHGEGEDDAAAKENDAGGAPVVHRSFRFFTDAWMRWGHDSASPADATRR
jgi:hypothetical protein